MNKDAEIHISMNRLRIKMAVLVYVLMAILAFGFTYYIATDFLNGGGQTALKLAGGCISLFILLTGLSAAKMLQKKRTGIHLMKGGIEDWSTSLSLGFIEWSEIRDIQFRPEEKMILVMVKKPQEILKRAGNRAIRQLLERNIKDYETPVVIETKYLDASFEVVKEKIESKQDWWRTKK